MRFEMGYRGFLIYIWINILIGLGIAFLIYYAIYIYYISVYYGVWFIVLAAVGVLCASVGILVLSGKIVKKYIKRVSERRDKRNLTKTTI